MEHVETPFVRRVVKRLLIRPGAIGDCILALPDLEAARFVNEPRLKGAVTSAKGAAISGDRQGARSCGPAAPALRSTATYLEVWAPRPVLPLIQFVDHTRAIADTGLDLIGVVESPRAAACLRDLATFDSVYSWYGANRPEFRDAVRHLPIRFFPALPINVTGVPRIHVPPRSIEHFAVIHPFSGSATKNWLLDSFRDLAANLPIPVKWCAGPEESLDNAIRMDNLYDLACWISTARVYIGNDSGISHLAAAVGVPTVAIFLTTDPRVWAPRGDHVTILENPSVDDVLDAVRSALRTRQ